MTVESPAEAVRVVESDSKTKNDLLPSIQTGRALAAFMVLLYHCGETVKEQTGSGFSNAGASGVDVFFVISGFVIYLVSGRDKAPLFFLKRLIRVGPPYWFYTTITVMLLLFLPQLYQQLRFEPIFVTKSYLFLLSETNVGSVGTVLGVGWTLAYEMYFYTLTTVALLLSRKYAFGIVAAVIIAGAAASLFVVPAPEATPMLSALPLEFLAGTVIARLYLGGIQLSRTQAWVAIAAGFAMISYAGFFGLVPIDLYTPQRVIWFGIPSVAIVIGLVSLDQAYRFPASALLVGSISYSLYLSHPFVLKAAAKLLSKVGVAPLLQVPVFIALALFVAYLSYRLIEKPSLNALSRRLRVRRTASGPKQELPPSV